jgi:hypothetical protein
VPKRTEEPVIGRSMAAKKGSKKSYTGKQKRKAKKIAKSMKSRGQKNPEGRAWAIVNATDKGGKKSGSGRGKKQNKKPLKKGGKKGGKKSGTKKSSTKKSGTKKRSTKKSGAKKRSTKKSSKK